MTLFKTPLFSVVVPVYNKGPHIRRCLESVSKQTFTNFEVIIVDDASTDGGSEIMKEIADRAGYTLLRRTRSGPGGYAARNLAMESARGKFIAFLDADDEWLPGHLENIAVLINKHPGATIYCSAYEIDKRGARELNSYGKEAQGRGSHQVDFREFLRLYANESRLFHTSVVVLEKDRLLAIGGFPDGRTNKGGDLYTWVKVMLNGYAAWTPHCGATVYTDAVNKVTQTAFFNPDLIRAMFDELQLSIGREEQILLRQYVNHLLLKDYLRCAVRTGKRGFPLPRYTLHTGPRHFVRILTTYLIPPQLLRLVHRRRKTMNHD